MDEDECSYSRSTKEQLDYYIQFLEKHPELQNKKTLPKHMDRLWEELVDELNAIKGPTRSVKKWKESLANWKNQIRSRAKKAKSERLSSSRNSKYAKGFTPIEQLAMKVFGLVDNSGTQASSELSEEEINPLDISWFPESKPLVSEPPKRLLPTVSVNCNETYEDSPKALKRAASPDSFCDSPPPTKRSVTPHHHYASDSPKRSHKRKKHADEMYSSMLQLMKERDARDRFFHEESMRCFQSISDSLNNVSASILTLAKALESSKSNNFNQF